MSNLTSMGDLDGDGYPEMLAVDATGTLWQYHGSAAGFDTRTSLGTNWDSMNSLTNLGDLNGDGTTDLGAVETATGKLWLYPGRRMNGFGTRVLIGNGGWTNMREIEGAGDLDQDGHPDLLAIDPTGILWLYPAAAPAGSVPAARSVEAGTADRAMVAAEPAGRDLHSAEHVTHSSHGDVDSNEVTEPGRARPSRPSWANHSIAAAA